MSFILSSDGSDILVVIFCNTNHLDSRDLRPFDWKPIIKSKSNISYMILFALNGNRKKT